MRSASLDPEKVTVTNPFSFPGADTLARITVDGYKDGGEGDSTRRLGMDVNPLNRDNHSGSGE